MSDPYCLAMVLCDAIHTDSTTGKKTILGTFSTCGAEEFPVMIAFAVYYALTDCPAQFDLSFRVVDSKQLFEDDVTPIFEIEFPVQSPSPLAVVEGQIFLQNATLSAPGVYHCELLAGQDVLMSRRLVVVRPSDLQNR